MSRKEPKASAGLASPPKRPRDAVVEVFAGRIRAAMEHEKTSNRESTVFSAYARTGFDPSAQDVVVMAERLATHVHEIISAYQVPKRQRDAVAWRLARHWDIESAKVDQGPDLPTDPESIEGARTLWATRGAELVAAMEYRAEQDGAIPPRIIWPTSVSLDEVRVTLERSRDPDAQTMARTIQQGRWYIETRGTFHPRREEYAPDPEREGRERITDPELLRALGTIFHPRIAALIAWAEKEVEKGQREARFFALPASVQARVPFEMMAQGESYAPRQLQKELGSRGGNLAVTTRAFRVVWDGRPTGEQLAFGFAIRVVQAEVFRDILRELKVEGLRDYVILHRMASEQGRTGRFTWTWNAHRRATLHDRRVQLGNVREDVARDAVVNRIWKLTRAELHAEETLTEPGKPSRRRWCVVGENPLVRVVGGDEEGGRIEGLTIILNEMLYQGARAEEGPHLGKYFTQLPEAVLRLPGLPFCLAVMLGFRFRYAADTGGTVELTNDELQAYMDAGRWRARSGGAADTLHAALTEAAEAFGDGASWEALGTNRYRVTPPRAWVDAVVHRVSPVLPPAQGKGPTTGKELVTWRETRELSQRDAAKALGVGFRTIQRAEGNPEEALSRAFRDLDWSKAPIPGK